MVSIIIHREDALVIFIFTPGLNGVEENININWMPAAVLDLINTSAESTKDKLAIHINTEEPSSYTIRQNAVLHHRLQRHCSLWLHDLCVPHG
jgi:hypothetical protein